MQQISLLKMCALYRTDLQLKTPQSVLKLRKALNFFSPDGSRINNGTCIQVKCTSGKNPDYQYDAGSKLQLADLV